MWIKPVIAVLFILLVIALLSGGFFLFKDQGAPDKRRILWSLGIRVGLAVALLAVISYGIVTGQLRSHAPWSRPMPTTPQTDMPAIEPAPSPGSSAQP
ncbi:MAG TPA: DUF2909 domain-containing protein [Pseudomonadales bacterium]|jgi:hypothetical protein